VHELRPAAEDSRVHPKDVAGLRHAVQPLLDLLGLLSVLLARNLFQPEVRRWLPRTNAVTLQARREPEPQTLPHRRQCHRALLAHPITLATIAVRGNVLSFVFAPDALAAPCCSLLNMPPPEARCQRIVMNVAG
jgi:hypothetical protein